MHKLPHLLHCWASLWLSGTGGLLWTGLKFRWRRGWWLLWLKWLIHYFPCVIVQWVELSLQRQPVSDVARSQVDPSLFNVIESYEPRPFQPGDIHQSVTRHHIIPEWYLQVSGNFGDDASNANYTARLPIMGHVLYMLCQVIPEVWHITHFFIIPSEHAAHICHISEVEDRCGLPSGK